MPEFNYCNGRANHVYLLCKYLKKEGHNITLITNGGDSLERIKLLNIKYFIFKDLQKKNPISIIKNLLKLKNICKIYNIDITHTHHRYNDLLTHLLKMIVNTKNVISVLSIFKRKKIFNYKSEIIIAVSNSVKENLINIFKQKSSKIKVIPHFIEIPNQGNNYINIKINENQTVIFSAGRFHYEKNYETLIKAIGLLNSYKLTFLLIGEGNLEEKYISLARENNLNLNLKSAEKRLEEYFIGSTICVLPSVVDPFPFFMLESGVYKKPFIGSNVDGMKELIRHKENGLLFEPGNHYDLAEKIEMFLNDTQLMKKCAENLHKEVTEKYTAEKIMPQIIEIYENLLKNEN